MNLRLPDIFYFNPTCEYAVANGNASWQPNRILQTMEYDLATIPSFFAKPEDIVLVPKKPSAQFTESFNQLGIQLPQFAETDSFLKTNRFNNPCFGKLLPWGWSPAAHKLLAPIKPNCSDEFKKSPVFNWNPNYKNYYSRGFSLSLLKEFISTQKNDLFLPEYLLPEKCTSQKQIEMLLENWGMLMIKAPWSSSGRGLQPIKKIPVHPKVWEKIMGIINEQGYVVVEPFLNKTADLAFQFKVLSGKITFLGISNFTTDQKGQYQGNYINGLPAFIEKKVAVFMEFVPKIIIQPLIEILEKSELAKNFEGNFGVDTLIYRDKNNQLKINPFLEINVRQNMGLLSLYLKNLVSPGKKAYFRMYFQPGIPFENFKTEMEKKHPLVISEQKIEKGFFPTSDWTENKQFGSYLLI